MKKRLLLIGLMLAAALMTAGCGVLPADEDGNPDATPVPPLSDPMFEDMDALYGYYNQVTFDDTVTTLTERLGEPAVRKLEEGVEYTWKSEDGYGVSVGTFPDGRVRGKVVLYDDARQFGKLSAMTDPDAAYNLTKDYTFNMCRIVLGGRPMEVLQAAADTSENPDIQRLYFWCDDNGKVISILFSGDGKLQEVSSTS